MKNTDFLNLELPEREDKINVGVLTSDFEIIEDIIKQHAVVETMELDGVGAITGAIGPYIRLQNISEQQVSIDIGDETIVLESGENKIIRETAQNIGVITSGNVHITYFTNAKTYTDRNFYDKKKVDELLSKVEATVEVDAELSEESENPVQNKAITEQFSHYYTITETDEKITEKVSEIVAGAPDDFNTLKEMSDWLTEHEDSAASMNSAIQKNAKDIVTANTNITKNTADIATANTNIQKNVDDITAMKNSVAINMTTLGTQCKNLCSINSKNISSSTGGFVIGTSSTKHKVNIEAHKIVVSWTGTATTGQSEIKFYAGNENVYTTAIANKPEINLEVNLTKNVDGITLYCNTANNISNIMIRYADIIDSTYESYKPSLQEQINNLLSVKTYNQTCFTKDSTQTDLVIRDDTYIKENAFAWAFNPHITYITKIPANTRTLIGTVSPPPPHRILKYNVQIHNNDNSALITKDAIIDIFSTGLVHITSPVAIREDGMTGNQGRININSCFVEALKFDLIATATTEGGE